MCEDCGCGDPELVPVEVQQSILAGNERTAQHNREHFAAAGVLAVNLMGSPGCGKTALLEATARLWDVGAGNGHGRLAALSGDLATDNDADRLNAAGIPSRSITTGSACHLDAALVHRALHGFPWQDGLTLTAVDLLFVENVGNLVCPAVYDLGQAASVVALSVTEGEDKPLKYPVMFRKADLVLVTKVDLLPHLPGVSMERIEDALARTMPEPAMIPVSAVTGQGIRRWIGWLQELRQGQAEAGRRRRSEGAHDHHRHDHDHHHPHVHT